MPKDLSKYVFLRKHVDQDFTILVGNPSFERPRLVFVWPDGEEVFMYFDYKDMNLIKLWAESYLDEKSKGLLTKENFKKRLVDE